jgi:hypothetical protein
MSMIGRAMEQWYAERIRDRIARARPPGFRSASPRRAESYHLNGVRSSRIQAWAESFATLPRPAIPSELESAIDDQDFPRAYELAGRALTTVDLEMLVTLPNVAKWPRLLGTVLGFGNHPGRERVRLVSVLELLHDLELRVFDGPESRQAFEDMPAQITVFRGSSANETESRQWGISWTLDRLYALKFAGSRSEAGVRLPRTHRDSAGMMLFATISRGSIAAVVRWGEEREIHETQDGEREVLICPREIDPIVQWVAADEAYRLEAQALDTTRKGALAAAR